eukprot:TRINITY_DN20479_c0_g1_i1.p1 TRINITY_DN20479_c0_g1~~TRINITY_DN20479_c0_g1_i1.p1  ORF type:complete len:240 (-),score=29.07 TRINITY_DN20479_c0_g1_i1:220-939(-)
MPVKRGELLLVESPFGDLHSFADLWRESDSPGDPPWTPCPLALIPRNSSQVPSLYLGYLPFGLLPDDFWRSDAGEKVLDYLRYALNVCDSGLYVVGSFFNHSCAPNAALVSPDGGADFGMTYALRNIDAGEEVTWCFQPEVLELPRWRRQQVLFLKQGFWCNCSRCREGKYVETSSSDDVPLDVLLAEARRMVRTQTLPKQACQGYVQVSASLVAGQAVVISMPFVVAATTLFQSWMAT